MVMGDTIERSGANAAVIKYTIKMTITTVTICYYCKSHPLSGGKQIVSEVKFNICWSKTIAIWCLNFGNPENEVESLRKNIGVKCEFRLSCSFKYSFIMAQITIIFFYR